MSIAIQNSISGKNDVTRALYGDVVLLLNHIVIVPVFAWVLFQMEPDDPKRSSAVCIVITMFLPIMMLAPAVFFKSVWFSRMALLAGLFFLSLVNLLEWPYEGECIITNLVQGGVVMGVMANISLSFTEKLIRLAIKFTVASYVSIQSPHSVYVEDTLPILGGTILVAIFLLYVYHFSVARELATVQGAQLVLAVLFMYHTIRNLSSMDPSQLDHSAYEHFSDMMKAAAIATIGFIATGTFQMEIFQKEKLEILVRKRTQEIELQSQKLHMVNMALEASETAIAIMNKGGHIIWVNVAFEELCQKKENSMIGRLLKDEIYKLDPSRKENKFILMESYEDASKPAEKELLIGDVVFRLESTPFAEATNNHSHEANIENDRFLIAFKNITAIRAKEVAEKKAQDEATMAKAMGESMVTLTHELRTPLQGIMGITSLMLQQAGDFSRDMNESLKLIMASSSLLLNLINNLLDVKKATAKSKSTKKAFRGLCTDMKLTIFSC
mmetsp:Transcript_22346/g.33778  ORF Transcript_22346/g.33778 Transcript_22346/m.33778 type:complete len:498 (-) Transcript_22346:1317-2810(-)